VRRYVSFRDFDWVLLTFVLLICLIGVAQIYSATLHTKFAGAHIKQLYWIIGGLALMFLISLVNYEALLDRVHWLYGIALISLVLVLTIGQRYLGARRWIKLPLGVHFQPSEWVKLILILVLAKYFSELRQRGASLGDLLKAGLIGGIPGIQARHAIALLLIGGILAVPAFRHLKPYQRDRLTSFLHPDADSLGRGYQGEQSKIAVGAGSIWGKGFTKGSQTQNSFLPIPQTDFIFAALGEEQGFVGAMGLLLLYFVVLMRLLHNAQTAPDRAGTLIVMGVIAVLSFHILVNVGMAVGFMPVTGIPLPLMSYGGSSLLFTFLALGIVMNIRMRRFVN